MATKKSKESNIEYDIFYFIAKHDLKTNDFQIYCPLISLSNNLAPEYDNYLKTRLRSRAFGVDEFLWN